VLHTVDQQTVFIVSLYKRPLNFPVNIRIVFSSYSLQVCRLLTAINTVFHSQFLIQWCDFVVQVVYYQVHVIPHRVTCCCVQFSSITGGLLANTLVTQQQVCETEKRFAAKSEIKVHVLPIT